MNQCNISRAGTWNGERMVSVHYFWVRPHIGLRDCYILINMGLYDANRRFRYTLECPSVTLRHSENASLYGDTSLF